MHQFREELAQNSGTREFEPREPVAQGIDPRDYQERQQPHGLNMRQFEPRQTNGEMYYRLPESRFEPRSAVMEESRPLEKAAAPAKSDGDGWIPAVTIGADGGKKYSHWAVEVLDAKQYTVKEGEDLYTIARRSLGVTGHPDATKAEIKAEMKRIADLNQDGAPGLLKHHGKIKNGLTLRLAAPVRERPTDSASRDVLPQVQLDCDENY
ncbi:MAG: LysM peptidoglycan-binding domain-containing protein [Cyanobacteria bacterium SZAS LIN-2]|nr:LysM peptidoglycan-binding domain-containing protein [Cyanobacteria bacterium SZAS LIN-3]MBS1995493.1 LysM peptidoglycan-binding domain-containing protein [Cyanobacteria bacterium SZAS LIN-2]MBS2005962.1 LysM peptidoglycan-binding domain-containing protein [Cyanobacteria bacterium SZAS TMP-1]